MIKQKIDLQELEALLSGYWLTDLANFSAFLFEIIPDMNWVGFYLSDGKKLRLGPFCGKSACMEIPFENGVCGHAFAHAETLIHQQPFGLPVKTKLFWKTPFKFFRRKSQIT